MASKAIKHPIGCKNFTVRYQWISEMCGYRRTEADIVGVLIGYTEAAFEKSGKGKKDGWDVVDISVSLLSRMACTSVRATQTALRWLEIHGIVKTMDRVGKGGLNLRRGYRLDLDLLDDVSAMRDQKAVPVQVAIDPVSKRVTIIPIPGYGRKAATGVQKRRDTTMVQKLHGDGAENAGYGAENAPLGVQKVQGTSVQELHPCYHGVESQKDRGYSIPALDTVEGDCTGDEEESHTDDEREDIDYREIEEDEPSRSPFLDMPGRGYRPDRSLSSLPPLKPRIVPLPGARAYA